MKTRTLFRSLSVALGIALWTTHGWAAETQAPIKTFAQLPIKEITVFKDGHAFVAHEGEMPVNAEGNVVMDYLPAPVIGTFWPYSASPDVKLKSVVAGRRRVDVDHTAFNLRELLEANIGAEAIITETGKPPYDATIVSIPSSRRESQNRNGPMPLSQVPPSRLDGWVSSAPVMPPEKPEEKGNIIILKTAEGFKVLPLDRIQDVTFKNEHKAAATIEESRDVLTLKLDWGKAKPAASARVGLFYLQKGVRWIPSYKVELDGKGHAVVKMQATLLNELADLEDASVNLVVGVPTFAFKDTLDPMSVQQGIAQLSQYFQSDTGYRNSPVASQFSNAIMSQAARMNDYRGPISGDGAGTIRPDITDSNKSEDLFVFRVEHVTLRRGERMVMPVAEFTLSYRDVFTLELPFSPPPELRGNINSDQQREMARLINAPKALHKIRLLNDSKYPLTTAPALMIRNGMVLAQGMMTYTSVGASADVALTTAVDIQVKKSESEGKRTPNAVQENGNSYSRVDLSGKITLTNHRSEPAEVEVTRVVLGAADTAEQDGKVEKLNVFENGDYIAGGDYPNWWGWYSWPSWWNYFNGVGRVTWNVKLAPGQTVDLGYQWHYFWR